MRRDFQSSRWVAEVGLGVAAAVLLPAAFHQVGLGPVFLPMHFPVLIVGALSGPRVGFLTGALAPALSYLTTGMPPFAPPVAPLMMIELAVYGLAAGIARKALTGRPAAESRAVWLAAAREYPWLIVALLAGRAALGAAAFLLGPTLGLKVAATVYLKGALLTGLPGLVLQLAVIPPLMVRLKPLHRFDVAREADE